MKNNISIKEAAKIMNKSEMFIRIGLQQGKLPIGVAVKTSSKYTYHISPKLLEEYIGVKIMEKDICTKEDKFYKME